MTRTRMTRMMRTRRDETRMMSLTTSSADNDDDDDDDNETNIGSRRQTRMMRISNFSVMTRTRMMVTARPQRRS